MEQSVSLAHMSGIKSISSEFSQFGDDYIFARVRSDSRRSAFSPTSPLRINGVMWVLCMSGNIDMEINLTPRRLTANSMMMVGPDNIISVNSVGDDDIDCYFLFISADFLRDTNIDLNVLNSIPDIAAEQRPVVSITPAQADMLRRLMEMVHLNTVNNPDEIYVRSISRNLIASVCYQMIQIGATNARGEEVERPRSRRATYVFQFKALVHKYHRRERSVSFYADKMFISPKYLSLIIKESTGRSAAEWIDEFVILEAKNMLRFSGKNIQQVAYDLNFSNQSSFGKYFKHLTGMSPSQYQRS